jgi:hypothetical protein
LGQPRTKEKRGIMKAKQKTTKAKKTQVKVRDIKPQRSPSGGRKHKRGGGDRPVEYLKYKFDAPLISG